jgi:hypothetical protein
VVSTRDVRLIVDGNEIGIGVAKCVGRACNRACWTVYDSEEPESRKPKFW